jgi:hypothetical protein
MGVDTKGRRSKKRQKLEKLKKEAKRRLKAKSKAKEKENLKEIAMGARLKKRSEIKSEEFRQIGLSEQMLGARDKSEAISEVMGQNEEAMMDGRRKKASKARSKEKVDFKKLFRVSCFIKAHVPPPKFHSLSISSCSFSHSLRGLLTYELTFLIALDTPPILQR